MPDGVAEGCSCLVGFKGAILAREIFDEGGVALQRQLDGSLGLAAKLDLGVIRNINARAIVAHVCANLPRQCGMLIRRVIPKKQNRWCAGKITQGSLASRMALKRGC